MRVVAIGLTVILLAPTVGNTEPETGTICVAARADDPFRGQVIPPPARSVPTVFKSRSIGALPFLGHKERVSKLRDWI